jgi:hypothetical protein
MTLAQDRNLTAEAQRRREVIFLFGGERPPNKKPSFVLKHEFYAI